MIKVQELLTETSKVTEEYEGVLDYFKENRIWFTRNTHVPLSLNQMSDKHLRNCIHVMEDALEDGAESEIRRNYYLEMLPVMKQEYEMRKENVAEHEYLSDHNAGCISVLAFSHEL